MNKFLLSWLFLGIGLSPLHAKDLTYDFHNVAGNLTSTMDSIGNVLAALPTNLGQQAHENRLLSTQKETEANDMIMCTSTSWGEKTRSFLTGLWGRCEPDSAKRAKLEESINAKDRATNLEALQQSASNLVQDFKEYRKGAQGLDQQNNEAQKKLEACNELDVFCNSHVRNQQNIIGDAITLLKSKKAELHDVAPQEADTQLTELQAGITQLEELQREVTHASNAHKRAVVSQFIKELGSTTQIAAGIACLLCFYKACKTNSSKWWIVATAGTLLGTLYPYLSFIN